MIKELIELNEATKKHLTKLFRVHIAANVFDGVEYKRATVPILVAAHTKDIATDIVNSFKSEVSRFAVTLLYKSSAQPLVEPDTTLMFRSSYHIEELHMKTAKTALTKHGAFTKINVAKLDESYDGEMSLDDSMHIDISQFKGHHVTDQPIQFCYKKDGIELFEVFIAVDDKTGDPCVAFWVNTKNQAMGKRMLNYHHSYIDGELARLHEHLKFADLKITHVDELLNDGITFYTEINPDLS